MSRPKTDPTWWPNFWGKRWSKYDLPNPSTVLDFHCVDYVNDEHGQNVVTYLHPVDGEFSADLLYPDNTFDALVFHSSINKDPRIRLGHVGLPNGKANSIIGTGWMLKDACIARWSELYRVSKPGAVWFISCYKHVEHHYEVEELDIDRHGKTIIVEGW